MGTVPCSTSQQGTAPGTINLISQVNDAAAVAQEAFPAPPLPPQLCVDVIKGGRKLSVIHGHALIFFPPLKIFLDRLWAKKKRWYTELKGTPERFLTGFCTICPFLCAQDARSQPQVSPLTEVSSEQDAMMFSMKGFHLMSSTLPWWPHTLG